MIDRTICVIENGLFMSLALRLSKEYERVLYFRPWISSFSHPNFLVIGSGYKNIQRLENLWDHIEEIDTFCFPDIHFADMQNYLRGLGKPVWGAGNGEELEILRAETKQLMEEVGLPTAEWEAVYGVDALRDYLEKNENVFVKCSKTRGLFESFKSINYDLSKPKIDEIEHELGGLAGVQEFVIEDEIPDAVETGYDGWSIDGAFPKTGVISVECKDCGSFGMVNPYAAINPLVREVNTKLAPEMKKYGYRGFFSTEVRIKDKKPYLIDVTARMASPCGETFQDLFSNLGEVIEVGAHGELIDPKPVAKYAAQAILTTDFAEDNWLPIQIEPKIRDSVKLYHSCIIDGQEYVVPTHIDMPQVGSVIGVGNTVQEAIKDCKKKSESIQAFGLKCNTEAMEKAQGELAKVQ